MSAVTFDTLKYVETLKIAGVPEPQAKAQSEALKEVLNTEVATKHDPRLSITTKTRHSRESGNLVD